MDIVEEMRGFEADHEPEGWPAVKMRQVSALCTELEQLRKLASDAHEAWDKDRDIQVGKLLKAMLDDKFRKTYRPDLTPSNE